MRPLLYALGQGTIELGDDPAAAAVAQLCGNFLIAAATEAMAEAFTLAEKSGVPRTAMADLIGRTILAWPVYQNYGKAIAEERYEPALFRLALGLKDLSLVLGQAGAAGVPMPFASIRATRWCPRGRAARATSTGPASPPRCLGTQGCSCRRALDLVGC